jgi:hypothetical protein
VTNWIAAVGSGELPDPRREEHRERDPDDRPAERLAERRDVRLAIEDAEVDREDAKTKTWKPTQSARV